MTTTISSEGFQATIKHFGAELISLKNHDNTEYLWDGNPEFWGKHSPILFPIVGTLKDNKFQYDGGSYTLSRHGFARDMEFECEKVTAASASFVLKSNAETLKKYPFQFLLRIVYTLSGPNLEIAYEVENHTNSEMYFSIGAHPAFALPGNFEDYSLAINGVDALKSFTLQNDLISGETKTTKIDGGKLPLDYTLFEQDALILKDVQFDAITILKNDKPLLNVHFPSFPDLGLWTKPNAPFLCIEPWFGYSDTSDSTGRIEEKPGIVTLGSNETFAAKFNIEIIHD
ncbi:MAG: aldose epimerase [Flavobacterium sp. BFFFF1]|uniref:aldose 1-epimerase family protein n=1 Tax=Flavobacterium sp. BFFFF1 TaxID=2015557 RepID=UPI000BD4E530|nr:aldose 1-epimerase family protein [Flavobacterium sp. BFFFF1]OYU80377.1 MAG: aldose epimerase [Flavobacterium sp. BFFFF1]